MSGSAAKALAMQTKIKVLTKVLFMTFPFTARIAAAEN
jgi:hypothetical protein